MNSSGQICLQIIIFFMLICLLLFCFFSGMMQHMIKLNVEWAVWCMNQKEKKKKEKNLLVRKKMDRQVKYVCDDSLSNDQSVIKVWWSLTRDQPNVSCCSTMVVWSAVIFLLDSKRSIQRGAQNVAWKEKYRTQQPKISIFLPALKELAVKIY